MYRQAYLSALFLFMGAATAAAPALDLSDFDQDAMRAVEDAAKELESSIPHADAAVTQGNAEFIRDSLIWAEGYFAGKNATEAAQLAREGSAFAAQIAARAAANEFAAAGDAFDSLKRTCKSCHDAYKPPSL